MVNVELGLSDDDLRKEGSTYANEAYSCITQFDKFLLALVNSVNQKSAESIDGCPPT